jgi:hypothetical protein
VHRFTVVLICGNLHHQGKRIFSATYSEAGDHIVVAGNLMGWACCGVVGLAQFRCAHEIPGHIVSHRMKGKENWPEGGFFGTIWP